MFGSKGEELSEVKASLHIAKKESEFYSSRVDELKEEIKELKEQISRLQDALVAKHSPTAYLHEKLNTPEEPETPEQTKARLEAEAIEQTWNEYVDSQEQPLFNSVDDLDKLMDRIGDNVGAPETESLHDNEES